MLNYLCAGRIGLDWAHDAISFAYHMFMHSPCIHTLFSIYLLYLNCFGTFLIVSLSLPLFLFTLVVSMAPKRKSTPSQNPLRFGGIVFFWSYSSLSSVSWWECPKGLLGELFSTRCSFGKLSHFRELCRHWPSHCHSQSGIGVTMWRLGHLSIPADSGVLLQHAWTWLFNTSFYYSRSRYMHCGHTGSCI